MNALFLMSAACISGADPIPVIVETAKPEIVLTSGCGGGNCGGGNCCSGSCDSCGRANLLDRVRARFASMNQGCGSTACGSTGCGTACAPASSCAAPAPRCRPACGTPLFSGRGHCCQSTTTCCSAPTQHTCNSCDSGCGRVSLLDRIRARFAARRDRGCCNSGCGATSNCCGTATPSAAPAAPAPDAPKEMPKTSSLVIPPIVTPTASVVVPSKPQPAPAPTPVLSGKSPF